MWKMLTIVAVLASLAAFVMVLNVQHERDEAIREALKRHEAEIVQKYAPLLRQIAESSGVTTVTLHPETVQELVAALTEIAQQGAANREAAASSEAMNSLDRPILGAAETGGATAFNVGSSRADGSFDDRSARRGAPGTTAAPPRSSDAQHYGATVNRLDHSLTPEGEILFADLDASTGNVELVRMNAHSGAKRRVPGDFGNVSHPVWSRDGKQIAFVSDRDGQDDIYLLDPRSQEAIRITETAAQESWITWSRDGSHLAFEIEGEDQAGIQVLPVDPPGESTTLSLTGTTPDWSPSRSLIAFVDDKANELRVSRPDGSDVRTLMKWPDAETLVLVRPLWLPNGRSIIVTRWAITTADQDHSARSELLEVDATSGRSRIVPMPPGVFLGLCCSPDGKYVLTVGVRDSDEPAHFYAVNLEDGRYKPVGNTLSIIRDASWSMPGKENGPADAVAQNAPGVR